MRTFALQSHSYAQTSMRSVNSATGGATCKGSLTSFVLTGTLLLAPSVYAGASFQGASFQGASFQGASFQGASFQGASFQGPHDAWLEGTALMGWLNSEPVKISSFRGAEVVAMSESRSVVFHPTELIGLSWSTYVCDDAGWCASVTYRIAQVAQDTSLSTMPVSPDNSDIWLYELEYAVASDSGMSPWSNVCNGQAGTRGLFVDGRWDDEGRWEAGGYSFSCPNGVIAKCARAWGYKPWKSAWVDGAEVSLAPLHVACTRAARADYCGDGVSYTQEGTLVDIFDIYGLNVREQYLLFTAESAFDEGGSLWVERTRWQDFQLEVTEDDWIFPNCEVPRNASSVPAEAALIYVWSDPSLVAPEEP